MDANKFYEVVTQNTAEREEIDRLMRQRAALLKRIAKVERAWLLSR